ncbi:HEAT repeat domain-containing protein [Streptomyces sp. NBC_01294]|uniref:HEAT repeat domain-containing protein n=1 Tax=Streptomyces sp. NBC_01294 TaxID=2903815 RepID=UPI002DDBCCB6|nr:HEAT repeat domain-containing protein [Streptomyces sp. NBC_01294]WRZ55369.1 HEAT repeat domain-containing protein [Streptomyces sp. NBC_01294]WRZ61327.1 HEAT repeat domain-containing protein [Streptomyces sp. NBC_01294]
MTTPADKSFHDALCRADVDWLTGHLDARLCTPAVFGRLLRHGDPRLRHLGLFLLAERVTSGRTGDEFETTEFEMAEFAGLLPASVEGPPEAALLLARLHERLGPYLRGGGRPSWRTADLPARVRIAWLRAELLNEPTAIRKEPPGELLYQAVRETTLTRVHRPEQLVDELVDSGDAVLQAEALRLAREGLHAGLLAPALVRERLISLLGAAGADVVAATLGELGQPWAALDGLPPGLLSPFLAAAAVHTHPQVADAALAAAAHHRHGVLLRQVVEDPGLPPGLRRRAMELFGDLADRGDIGAVTAIAARDTLLLGGPALTCLRGLHRRGHFPDAPHVPSLIGLALADHSIPAHEVATILFTCRQVMFRVLVDAAADDPSWPRRLTLLVALARQGTGELPIGDAIARLLPSAPAPGPFLDAIRALRHAEAEDAVIALLPSAPAAALGALEAIGGPRTVTALRDGLGLATDESVGVIAPHLRAVRHRALEVLWHLTHDPSQRRGLLVRLDPADLPARIAADLGGPDEQELALLSSHLDPDEPVAALCRLAAHGGAGTLPVIADLLLRIVAELAVSWEPGASTPRDESGQPAGEPVVPQEILHALRGLGRRLHERGRIRPSCLLDAATPDEAGHALVATLALDLLDRPGLSSGEQAILLELLLRAPYAGTRARAHRLLRHRDRRVRKQVIALLARDATGDDAQALSATLITLTAAQDIQTVRQALLALGHARARWASTAIAACLGHPNMNIKKTAAGVLVRASSPTAVPALLFWLGQHDNPGLRGTLVEALRAILGDAYPATVLAAAEHSEGGRARELLLAGLDGVLSARSVLALDDQASRVAPTLLTLVATRHVGLASGTVEDLSTALAKHGIATPAAPSPGADRGADLDIRSLTTEGWNPPVALRLAVRHELPHPTRLRVLRPMLPDWLRLAGSEPAVRARVLRLTLRLCPAPWTTEELAAFARSIRVLLDGLEGLNGLDRLDRLDRLEGLAEAEAEDRHSLIAVLEAVAPTLPTALKPAVADVVRGLPAAPAGSPGSQGGPGSPSTLTLLRSLGAVLVRADLEQALASARLGAHPRKAETAVLRDAFAAPQSPQSPHPLPSPQSVAATAPARAEEWRAALDAAVRTPSALEEFRRRCGKHDGIPGSRDRLTALIDVYASAAPEVRAALIDWMTDIQPLDAPPWTIAETTHAPPPRPRTVRIDDLDQPRSTALRERLLAMLQASAPDRRHTAAVALLAWPEPETRLPVLRAFLHGRIDVPVDADLARTLSALGEPELRGDDVLHDRVALVAGRLDPCDLEPLVPLLLDWWEHGPPSSGSAAGQALRRVPADVLAEHLGERLDAGAWGFLDLLVGRSLLRTPALQRTCRRLRAEGRDDLADRLLLVDGPLRRPDAVRKDAAALAALRDRAPAASTGASRPPSREELLALARTGDPVRIRRALTRLTEGHSGPDPDRDPGLRNLIGELLHHPKPKVRLHAHRTSRALLDRQTYLHHTSVLLADPRPDVVRTAIRILCHATWEAAIPAVTGLLEHPHPVVRRTAAEGLISLGTPAIPALRHAADHVRPDKRSLYTAVLEQIVTAEAE